MYVGTAYIHLAAEVWRQGSGFWQLDGRGGDLLQDAHYLALAKVHHIGASVAAQGFC